MRILIAEDDSVSRRILESMLMKYGYEVICASDGNEAWEYLQEKGAPKLVILDWVMPGIDGIEICRRIRKDPELQDSYVVMLTVKSQQRDIISALDAGADDYVIKPFDRAELRARIGVGERIVKLHQSKNELVSIVNHELRSPLTSILSALGLINDGTAGEVPSPIKGMFDIVYRNGERMLRLINDMLTLDKIESGKMEFNFQERELRPIIERSIEDNLAYAAQYDVKFVLKDNLSADLVKVDSDRLIQVLTNLLTNAAKFSPTNSEVEITLSELGNSVRVAVTDHGSGIPEKFHDQIFQKFSQAQVQNARQGGTGLGLSIAKAIIEEMDGSIDFETETNVGTTFYFDLPLLNPKDHVPIASANTLDNQD